MDAILNDAPLCADLTWEISMPVIIVNRLGELT